MTLPHQMMRAWDDEDRALLESSMEDMEREPHEPILPGERPKPTKCRACGYWNGTAWTVCPLCSEPVLPIDVAVFALSVVIVAAIVGGML